MSTPTWESLLSEQIRQNGRLFFRLAQRILRDAAAAEDVCQQAFLRAWEEQGKIEGGGPALKGWLARTVVNGSLQFVRRAKIERRALAGHAAAGTRADGLSGHDPAPWVREELRAEVLGAIARLPEPTRLVVVMRQLQGMSGNDVKELMGCSAAEVSRQLHRGLEQLRHLLSSDSLGDHSQGDHSLGIHSLSPVRRGEGGGEGHSGKC